MLKLYVEKEIACYNYWFDMNNIKESKVLRSTDITVVLEIIAEDENRYKVAIVADSMDELIEHPSLQHFVYSRLYEYSRSIHGKHVSPTCDYKTKVVELSYNFNCDLIHQIYELDRNFYNAEQALKMKFKHPYNKGDTFKRRRYISEDELENLKKFLDIDWEPLRYIKLRTIDIQLYKTLIHKFKQVTPKFVYNRVINILHSDYSLDYNINTPIPELYINREYNCSEDINPLGPYMYTCTSYRRLGFIIGLLIVASVDDGDTAVYHSNIWKWDNSYDWVEPTKEYESFNRTVSCIIDDITACKGSDEFKEVVKGLHDLNNMNRGKYNAKFY